MRQNQQGGDVKHFGHFSQKPFATGVSNSDYGSATFMHQGAGWIIFYIDRFLFEGSIPAVKRMANLKCYEKGAGLEQIGSCLWSARLMNGPIGQWGVRFLRILDVLPQ